MKSVLTLVACAVLSSLLACGGSSDTIQSLQISPQQGEGTVPNGAVGFTATGTFKSSQSRPLNSQDGLTWTSSDPAVGTINPLTGQATCVSVGSATITASVPNDLTFQGGGHQSSTNVSATASLQCVVPG